MIQPHALRPDLLGQIGAVAHIGDAEKQGDRCQDSALQEKFLFCHVTCPYLLEYWLEIPL